jgi:hypothetical protein
MRKQCSGYFGGHYIAGMEGGGAGQVYGCNPWYNIPKLKEACYMRKSLLIPLIFITVLTMAVTVALAADKTQVDVYDQQKNLAKSVVFVIGQDEYYVNNQTPGVKMDARPFIETGRTFVPVRYLSNALGVADKHIGWESPKVTLEQPGFPVVELAIGSKEIMSDGKAKAMDVSPLLRKGRTYLPARFVAEALGYQVAWDAENNIVLCWPRGIERPDVSNVIKYVKGQPPVATDRVNPPVIPEQPKADVRPFSGVSLDPDDYEAHGGWAIPHEFKQPGASIMYVTVDELRQKPVKLGNDEDGYMIFYDVQVTKDKVYVTQAGSGLTPVPIVLAKGNDVSVQRAYGPLIKYQSNPFTQSYYVSLEADPSPTKIEDVTHIMLLFGNQVLAVQNPLYKEAGK